jgi:hypothetical protein
MKDQEKSNRWTLDIVVKVLTALKAGIDIIKSIFI